jgi:hypothetical protein
MLGTSLKKPLKFTRYCQRERERERGGRKRERGGPVGMHKGG